MIDEAYLLAAIEFMKSKKTNFIEFDPGLSDLEIARAEAWFEFRFPPDLRLLLALAMPLRLISPYGPRSEFPNRRHEDDESVKF